MANNTSIEALVEYAGILSEAAQRSNVASELQHRFVNGGVDEVIQTESGPLPSLAKWRADLSMIDTALADPSDPSKGTGMVGHEGGWARDALSDSMRMLGMPSTTLDYLPGETGVVPGSLRRYGGVVYTYLGDTTLDVASPTPSSAWVDYAIILSGSVTLERLGGAAVPGFNNSPAMTRYKVICENFGTVSLKLNCGRYELHLGVTFKVPPCIHGVGAGVEVAGSRDGSWLMDMRAAGSAGFLLTLTYDTVLGRPNMGGVLTDFALVGNRASGNAGMSWNDIGWNFSTQNITILNFAKQGLLTYSVNDAAHVGLKILSCGGIVNGKVYYALDNGPHYAIAPVAGVTTNLQTFVRLHIEHCRFMGRINGFAQKFIGSHFEMFADSITAAGHSSVPALDLGYSGPANAFVDCTFVDVGYLTYANVIPDWVAPTPALKLAAIPAFIGSTAMMTGEPTFEGWRFSGCDFISALPSRYMILPGHTVFLMDCIIGRAFIYTPSVVLGAGSKVIGGRYHGTVPTVSADPVFGSLVGVKAGPLFSLPTTGIPADISGATLWFSTSASNVANLTNVSLNAIAGGVNLGAAVGNTFAAGYTQALAQGVGSFVPGALNVRADVAGGTRYIALTPGNMTMNTTAFNITLDSYPANKIRIATDGATLQLTPDVAAASYLGTSVKPWATIVSQTAVIVLSDEESNQQITSIDEAALRAWAKIEHYQYKFNDAVALKGDGARWHFGMIAQQVQKAFASEGLDAFEYGLLCYDEWEEKAEILDDEGAVIQEWRAAGSRYGIRYQEAEVLQAAYNNDRANKQDELIRALTLQVKALANAN